MSLDYSPVNILSITSVYAINIIQLFQALSFLKHAPKSGSWNSGVKDFIDWCKDVAIRVEDDDFLAMYTVGAIICMATIIVYMVLVDYIHKYNKKFTFITPFQYVLEYVVFGLGFIP